MRIGVLTGGGDCPGLNAAIRAVVRTALHYGWEVMGVQDGWAGLLGEGKLVPLNHKSVSGILHVGGTMLGTSRTNPIKQEGAVDQVADNFKRHKLDALVAIGGDDTLSVAAHLATLGLPVVGVPKTMDNDVWGTDYCIGFNSAVSIVQDALDRLHTTASAHHRVLVVEVMGRDAGWVAVTGGLAGGADLVLIPEVVTGIDNVCEHVKKRRQMGRDFSIIVVAEGAIIAGIDDEQQTGETDAFGHCRLDKRNIGDRLARAIETRTGFETRTTVLGHLQRGGPPSLFDRVLATRLGVAAVKYVKDGKYGYMPAMKGNKIEPVKLTDAVSKTKTVDLELYDLAQLFF